MHLSAVSFRRSIAQTSTHRENHTPSELGLSLLSHRTSDLLRKKTMMAPVGASSSRFSTNGALVRLAFVSAAAARWGSEARKPDGLVVVSRHGVRRQFPSSTHDFAKYAPGKVFQTEDEVRVLF